MTEYTPDEKLRLQQLRKLRRRWLKDQELSHREPVLPPQKMGPMEKFWNTFLENKSPWRKMVHGVYQKSIFVFTHILVPAWIIHYYMKYHVSVKDRIFNKIATSLLQLIPLLPN
ncbi:NADH dehydrogenase [ubiquinone] 1 beta subcomplex subunit 6 isoform X2 [Pongo pygmaeus]|uniref:NADH dehydrogenase [ubiquinone] 1 beta subcomplex subunit 6 isoform X2 n=1 Tax=Pongo pygmaeus TaxID=9600 RepID=UPI0023E26628|nr:NADH dehydrogenase [ubiquinone] 1 beta subcomplex subunit 6 isoform X2 [Pongo pygmaeus]